MICLRIASVVVGMETFLNEAVWCSRKSSGVDKLGHATPKALVVLRHLRCLVSIHSATSKHGWGGLVHS